MKLRPSAMDRAAFVQHFGALYEHSPWVAEQAWDAGIERQHDAPERLHERFRRVVMDAAREVQLDLLLQHPELGVARALEGLSREEQRGAGLDRCNAAEFDEFQDLNRRYRERFGFPFIVAVKGLDREAILAQFRQRIERSPDEEFDEALKQVCLIGRHRLDEAMNG